MDKVEKTLIDAVIRAGKRAKELQGSYSVADKTQKVSAFDFGLPADKESEKILISAIEHLGVDAQIISEESETSGSDHATYRFIMDPLDGTVNYSWRIPLYAIAVGVLKEGEPFLGIAYDPNLDELFIGKSGSVTLNGKRVELPPHNEQMTVNLEWFGAPQYLDYAKALKDKNIRVRSMGSGVLSLVYSIVGRASGCVLIDNKPWDIAPGYIMAKMLGTKIEQIGGNPVDLSQKPINLITGTDECFACLKDLFPK